MSARLAIRLCVVVLPFVACAPTSIASAAPNDPASAPPERPITDADRDRWAYLPIADIPVPAVDDPIWAAHPVDRFLRAEMEKRSIAPLPRVGRATLLRRVSFDLTGLPPSPNDVVAFLADRSPDAYERLVDRLLASPAYGERWAQHWLDLARFAETDGFEFDAVRPNAWRYRDWVIDALNRGMPFDEFLRLQLSGDELSDAPEAAIATGFLLCGPDMPDLNLQEERRHVVLNEMTATVGSVFLGMQVGCAQCHDHKYDPITQYDFYRLRAFFESADLFRDHPIPTAHELAARKSAEAAWSSADHENERRRRDLEELGRKRFRDKNPDERPTTEQILVEVSADDRNEHAALLERLRLLPRLPDLPLGRVVRDGEARPSHFYFRGDFRQPGPTLTAGIPRLLALASPLSTDQGPADATTQSRAALARWLTRPDNPLTARVIVNRLWQWHFGAGLSTTPSDFGAMGTAPTHPELLDWLARRFVADGWSFKKMHRLLVTSAAYQTASGPLDHGWTAEETKTAEAAWAVYSAKDPENSSLWRRRRMRLDGEALRDAMLAASERLSPRRGGPGVRPPLPPEVTMSLLKGQWQVSGDEEDHRRRSIYLFVRRNLRYPLFDVFDRPDTNASCAARHESTTAPQSLVLLNSQFSLDCACGLAGALLRCEPTHKARQIHNAYLRAFGRPPTTDEIRVGEEFLARHEELLRSEGRSAANLALPAGIEPQNPFAAAAIVDLCLALLNANEFLYLD